MSMPAKRHLPLESEPVRVLGRGLRAQRGVHLTMRVVREAAGKTQVDVAADSQMDQADVSRLESREGFDDCQVSTLQRYVTALGGDLELVAAFGNKKIVLCGVESGVPGMTPANKRMQRTRPARATKPRR
jgi:hypothetical protein